MSKVLTSYLANYAEPETRLAELPLHCRYDYALVVPAYSEKNDCIKRLMDNINNSVLLILVANAPPGDLTTTQKFVDVLLHQLPCQWSNQHLSLLNYSPHKSILLVDRCCKGRSIAKQHGVGLARKIGFDLALRLIDQGVVKSHWINTTDADVTLPIGYPNHESGSSSNAAARIYPFQHVSTAELREATDLYDLALHYYVEGLRYSGSPYAYHSIGSTLCIHDESYAKVRGFPRKSAGEDFYMLNKLSKVGSIECLNSPVLTIQARLSDRTPFGTGHAIQNILKLNHPLEDFLYYNPGIFLLLRNWLDTIPDIWPNRASISAQLMVQRAGDNSEVLWECLAGLGIPDAVRAGLDQYRSARTFERYLHQWFDAFRTLKFIHSLRDLRLSSVPVTAITNAPFFNNIDKRVRDKVICSR